MAQLVDNCINYNCDPLPDYDSTIQNCGSNGRKGGASTLYLFECGYLPDDPGDEEELDQMVEGGFATKLENLKMGFSDPSEVTQDPITSCGNTVTVTYDRTATIEDFKVTSNNTDFWNTAKKRVYNGAVLVECETTGLTPAATFIDAQISLKVFRTLPNTNKEFQKYSGSLLWSDIDDPEQVDWTAAA